MKYFGLLFILAAISCSHPKTYNTTAINQFAEVYCDKTMGFDKYLVTKDGYLHLAIDAIGSNYNILASDFLDMAKSEGVDLKGIKVYDSKDVYFRADRVDGRVIGLAN